MNRRVLDAYYSPAQVAAHLGVDRSWVYKRLPGKGGTEPRMLWGDGSRYWPGATDIGGGDWRIPAGDLNARLEQGRNGVAGAGLENDELGQPIFGRSKEELKRKVKELQTSGVSVGAGVFLNGDGFEGKER